MMALHAAKILIIDDDQDVLETARMFLKQDFEEVEIRERPQEAIALLKEKEFDVILLDMNFRKGVNDGAEGFHWLEQILKLDADAVVIPITAYGEVDLAVRAMKLGATDFVLKPWKNQKLYASILSALQLRQSKRQVTRLKSAQQKLSDNLDHDYVDFVGVSPIVQKLHQLIDRVAGTDANVLILGENGTGKELVARAIHRKSTRSEQVFINVDLGAIAESLFESELFGHVKGAFTDAKQDKPGRFEAASGGTLFLDEIGNLSLPLQAKLLTVLQSRKVQRVGSSKEIGVDFRLICATNMPLNEMVEEKTFRQDLLYRINTVEIKVPPLRERVEDIPVLADFYLKKYSQKYKRSCPTIAPSVMSKMKAHTWPGNIRELQHAIERGVILAEGNSIPVELLIGAPSHVTQSAALPQSLDEVEKQFLMTRLVEHEGHVSNLAKSLGMTRTALYRRLKKHGIR